MTDDGDRRRTVSKTSIDSVLLTGMFLAGARNLEANKETKTVIN